MKRILIALCLIGAAAMQAAVTVRTAALKLDGKKLIFENRLSGDWQNAPLTLSLFDGKAKKFIELPAPQITEKDGKITLLYTMPDLTWKLTFSAHKRVILGESTFINRSKEEKFLEQFITLAMDFTTADLQLWDGFGKSRKLDKTLSREGIKGAVLPHISASDTAFAATAVFSPRSAVSIGHVTFDPVSYTAVKYDTATKKYSYSQRFVLSAGEKLPLRHVLVSSVSNYGGPEGVIQQHYDSFPEVWSVVGGQENPYAWGNCSHYRTWWNKPDPEECRRMQTTHDWAYAPYLRAGDMLMQKELYNYTPDNPIKDRRRPKFGGKGINYKTIKREDFLRIRKENYLKYGKRFGWMFYNCCSGVWCERQLAEKYYPDSLTEDNSVVKLIKGWSTGHDWEVRVFPMGTSWAAAFERDMKILAEDLDLPGFALDCGAGGAYYRGPAVKKMLPGRAWDEKGAFIDQSVAVNHVVDYIHSLRPAPNQLTVHNNGEQKGDICMLERPFLNVGAMRQMLPLYRWFIGPRPGNVHGHGFLFKEMMPDWRTRTTPEFIDLIKRLSDYQIMNQFKWGLNQTYVTFWGNPQQIYIIPESLELIRAGWQSSTPVKISDKFYVPYSSRYGRGENSFFFFGNTSKKDTSGTIGIDNSELTADGKSKFVFIRKMRKTSQTLNKVDKNFTNIDAVLPSRVPVLYETVAGFVTAPEKFSALASSAKKLERQEFTIKLNGKEFTSDLVARHIRHWHLAELTVNGKKAEFSFADNRYIAKNIKFAPACEIKLTYKSNFFNISEKEIVDFPYVNSSKKLAFRLYVPKNDAAAEKLSQRLVEYFDFCYRKKILPAGSPPPMSRNAKSLTRKDVIAIQIAPDKANTIEKLANGGILIRAKDARTLEEMLRQFAGVMDIRFPFIFKFYGSMGIYGDQLSQFGMNGKYIPERRYFE